MSDTKLSALPAQTSPQNGDLFYVVRSTTSYQIAWSNLVSSLATSGANSNITSLSGLTTPLSVAQGGTGAATLTGIVKGNGTGAFTTVTAPSGTIVGTSDSQTLTNKAIDGDDNTLTDIPAANLKIASQAQGDILYRGASAWERLAAGTSGYLLKTLGAGSNPTWTAPNRFVLTTKGGSGTYNFNGMNYIKPCEVGDPNGTESNRRQIVPAMTLRGFGLQISANTLDGNLVITVRDDGSDTALTKTISSGTTGVQTLAADATVAASSLVSIKIDTTAAGSGAVTIESMYLDCERST